MNADCLIYTTTREICLKKLNLVANFFMTTVCLEYVDFENPEFSMVSIDVCLSKAQTARPTRLYLRLEKRVQIKYFKKIRTSLK